ncbi:MAG: TAT-variant-translocated molybdopterin oxidoreductase, partial [Verrucomicrobiaceae bacterium]
MKRVWQHPDESTTGRRYWRSLGEYANTPEFSEKLGREFDPGLAGETDEQRESSRREFMKIMGGVAALSGLALTSCRRPLQKIMPFTKHVEWVIPGKSLLYATSMPRPWGASPMVVVTHEGRPTHLQGNPLHPNGAGLDIFAQASILDLYNPERAQRPANRGQETDWRHFQKDVNDWIADWKKSGGEGLALLLNPSKSPTRAGLLADFAQACPKAKIFEYEPIHQRNYDAAVKALLGEGVALLPKLAKADRVFSLDCDFVGLDTLSETATRDFMKRRAPEKKGESMNRLYILENRYTLTGGISDHRKPLAASLIPVAAAVLAEEIGKLAGDPALQQAAAALAATADAKLREWIAPAAEDLFKNKGKSLVLAGPRHGEAVHAFALGINNALGAFGATLETLKMELGYKPADVAELKADITTKKIKHLIVLAESDPAYDAEDVFTVLKGLEKRPAVTHLTDRPKYTTKFSGWALPAAHYLESWSDVRSGDGTYSVVQPMIQPLFDGASVNDILLAMLGRKKLGGTEPVVAKDAAPAKPVSDAAYEAVKATFAKIAGGWDEEKWNNTLRDGFLAGAVFEKASVSFNSSAIAAIAAKAEKPAVISKDAMEVVLTPDAKMWDGRYSDNAWLQEAPDPITKLTWDNAAWLSPRTFAALGLKKDGDFVKVTVGAASLNIPALSAPGHAHDSVTIPLGYGQKSFNVVGNERGFNAYALRSGSDSFVLSGAKVEKAGGNYELAITQDNYTMEGRAQVREGTKERFDKEETFAQTEGMDSHIPPAELTLYKGRVGIKSKENPEGFDYENEHQWGMVIDLAKCIGCSACIVACQSENNIPVVGKDQVARGRVMQWIRMD